MAHSKDRLASAAQEPLTPNSTPGDDEHPVATDGFIVPDLAPTEDAPPAYGERPDQVQFSQPGFDAGAEVRDDGRVSININTKTRRLRDLLAPTLAEQDHLADQPSLPPAYIPPSLGGQPGQTPPPKLNVVIQIVGSRGDVQPFMALGQVLRDTYSHRVRIATHPVFKDAVEEAGLEFFSIGGDPAELMAFMVKNPGLMPGIDALKSGEVTKRRKGIQTMLIGCWRSCIEAGNGLGPPPKPHAKHEPLDLSRGMPGNPTLEPFVADAIIANPPSFAHVHVAEKLGIPLHMMFTMPWSPTRAFPHPLADVQSSNADDVMTNYLTYTLVEMMTWQGLGDIINRFREKALDLSPLSLIWAPGLLNRLKIPYTYCWSPALIPKPNDWGRNVDISGFFFLNLASSYTPDDDLAAFLNDGPPPVYIGFGSIVVDDPDAMTRLIFEAVKLSGVRALVSKGWGGIGADDMTVPDNVFMLGNIPHDWLFEHVSCVVHHGGAGTTSAGIKAGKPTVVVPFFGDQPFWGSMIARAGAGPEPVPYKSLTAEKLAESIQFCLKPESLEQAKVMGQKIREEQGTDVGGQCFHNHLDVDNLRCSLAPSRTAVWRVRRSQVRLSAFAAAVLVERKFIDFADLKLYRSREHNTDDQPPDPISAGASSLVMDMSSIGMAIADMPRELFKSRQRLMEKQKAERASTGEGTQSTGTANETASLKTEKSAGTPAGTPKGEASAESEPFPVLDDASTSRSSLPDSSSPAITPTETASSRTTMQSRARASSDKLKKALSRRDSSPVGVSMEAVASTGRGVEKIVTTGVKSPMNFCLGLAKGFRNVPKLYHDETVRPTEKVTDFNSGLRVASKEFGYGLFDGISGLVTQPLRGAEKDGAAGLVKGFGKGIGGIATKPAAGFWGIPAYTMQGVHAELNKRFARSSQNYIITSRVVQGKHELASATRPEMDDIVARWNDTGSGLKGYYQYKAKDTASAKASKGKGKQPASPESPPSHSRLQLGKDSSLPHLSALGEKRRLGEQMRPAQTGILDSKTAAPPASPGASSLVSDDPEFERAIEASVRETSKGNAEEDAMIENALRESVKALRKQAAEGSAARPPEKDLTIFNDDEYKITDEEYQDLVEQAIHRSIAHHSGNWEAPSDDPTGEKATGTSATGPSGDNEDPDLQRALAASRQPPHLPPRQVADDTADDEEMKRALAASKDDMERANNERNEEEVVLEYIKRQSLAEEKYRQKHRKPAGEGSGEGGKLTTEEQIAAVEQGGDDEDMKRAIEESLKGGSGSGAGGGTKS